MSEEGRVCPRCGARATGSRFCQSCGLNLERQGELRASDGLAATEASGSESQSADDGQPTVNVGTTPGPKSTGTGKEQPHPTEPGAQSRWAWIAVGSLIVLAALAVAAWQIQAVDIPGISDDALPMGDDPEQRPPSAAVEPQSVGADAYDPTPLIPSSSCDDWNAASLASQRKYVKTYTLGPSYFWDRYYQSLSSACGGDLGGYLDLQSIVRAPNDGPSASGGDGAGSYQVAPDDPDYVGGSPDAGADQTGGYAEGYSDCPDIPDVGPTGSDPADAVDVTVRGAATCSDAENLPVEYFKAEIANPSADSVSAAGTHALRAPGPEP